MRLRQTLRLQLIGLTRIPQIAWCGATVAQLDAERAEVRVPLGYRTRNHLGSMYVGALATGADLAVGLLTEEVVSRECPRVRYIFKDFHADFLRRADGPTRFACEDGRAIAEAVRQADRTGERVLIPVHVVARVEGASEPAARFQMALSLKRK